MKIRPFNLPCECRCKLTITLFLKLSLVTGSPISTRPVGVRLIAFRRRSEAKVEAAAQFGNDTRRGQRRKVDDTHVRHFFGQAQRKSNEVKPGRIDAASLRPSGSVHGL
jgi:hypothetical protein